MRLKKYLNHFLKNHSIEDVMDSVVGELNEYSNKDYTAFYGNGELILYIGNSETPYIYHVDNIGFYPTLVEG